MKHSSLAAAYAELKEINTQNPLPEDSKCVRLLVHCDVVASATNPLGQAYAVHVVSVADEDYMTLYRRHNDLVESVKHCYVPPHRLGQPVIAAAESDTIKVAKPHLPDSFRNTSALPKPLDITVLPSRFQPGDKATFCIPVEIFAVTFEKGKVLYSFGTPEDADYPMVGHQVDSVYIEHGEGHGGPKSDLAQCSAALSAVKVPA